MKKLLMILSVCLISLSSQAASPNEARFERIYNLGLRAGQASCNQTPTNTQSPQETSFERIYHLGFQAGRQSCQSAAQAPAPQNTPVIIGSRCRCVAARTVLYPQNPNYDEWDHYEYLMKVEIYSDGSRGAEQNMGRFNNDYYEHGFSVPCSARVAACNNS